MPKAKFNHGHGNWIACVALFLVWAGAAFSVGEIYFFAQGFSNKFHSCLDLVSGWRLSYAMFFVPTAAGMWLISARPRKLLLFLAAASVVFYGWLFIFWTGRGCGWNYELIHWGGLVAAFLGVLASANRIGCPSRRLPRRSAAFCCGVLAAACSLAWAAGVNPLETLNDGIYTMTAGVWRRVDSSLVGAASVLLMALAPSLAASIRSRKFVLLPISAGAGAAFYALIIAAPHALGLAARFVEPISFSGMFFPVVLGLSLRFEAKATSQDV